jgi:hypothetical protein
LEKTPLLRAVSCGQYTENPNKQLINSWISKFVDILQEYSLYKNPKKT